jgi:hypothetical protein
MVAAALYIGTMSKSVELRWRITRIRGNRADRIGIVQAPDAKAAIKIAIREFKITNPEDRKRVAAMPDG